MARLPCWASLPYATKRFAVRNCARTVPEAEPECLARHACQCLGTA